MDNIINLLTKEQSQKIKVVEIDKNITLFHENDICDSLGVVLEGELIISSYSYKGNELIYNHLYENDIFGINLIFSREPKYQGNVTSLKKSKVALIKKPQLLSFLSNNEAFMVEYLKRQSDFGKRANSMLKLLSLSDAEERFIYYLKLNKNVIFVKNVTDLAAKLFFSRETVSRLITKLSKKNIIVRKGHLIKLI